MASPIFGLEFFKAGDYTKHNKGNWRVDHEIKEVINNFFEDRKKGISVPIFWSPKKGHDTVNAIRVGSLTNAHLKGEVIVGDGQYMDEYRPLIEKRGKGVDAFSGLESVSATFTADQKRLKNIVLLGGEPPQIKGLKPVYEAVFSGDNEGIVIEFSMENKENKPKEKKNMPDKNDLIFSQSDVDLRVKDTTDSVKAETTKELTIKFSKEIEEKNKTIELKDTRIKDLETEVAEKDKLLLEFSQKQQESGIEKIEQAVEGAVKRGAILPATKDHKLRTLKYYFSQDSEEAKELLQIELEKLEKGKPVIDFSENTSDQEDIEFSKSGKGSFSVFDVMQKKADAERAKEAAGGE